MSDGTPPEVGVYPIGLRDPYARADRYAFRTGRCLFRRSACPISPLGYETCDPSDISVSWLCGSRRAYELRSEPDGCLSSTRCLRRPHPQRREAGRAAGRAVDQRQPIFHGHFPRLIRILHSLPHGQEARAEATCRACEAARAQDVGAGPENAPTPFLRRWGHRRVDRGPGDAPWGFPAACLLRGFRFRYPMMRARPVRDRMHSRQWKRREFITLTWALRNARLS